MTINGGVLTIDTDTRWHANAPASMTGTLGSPTISATLGGGLTVDARNVRWLAYDTGSGNVPAIGTAITQGGISGYLLGVYDALTSAPTAVGAAVPANGFIKFKSVTGGSFTSGALTGIGASATGADKTGWLEVVLEATATITTSRVGSGFVTRGDWFYLDDTTATIGQVLQVPTNGGGDGTMCPGVWIETAVASDEYEFWPALHNAPGLLSNGWFNQSLGAPRDSTDGRQKFVKMLTNGQMQIGEALDQSATYASVSQASTYATTAQSSTYTWVANVVKVTFANHRHKVGEEVYLDFTSGGATANDGLYTITEITGPNTFNVALTGSGAAGNVTVNKLITVTFTSHGLSVGEEVYLDFTTGAAVDGPYTVYSVTGANTYTVLAPQATTSGNATAVSRITVTFTAHGKLAGTEVYLDFTSGTGVDGYYEIRDLPTAVTANAFTVMAAIAPGATGNVTIRTVIGHVPVTGLRTRVPNIFLRQTQTTDGSTYAVTSNVCTVTETGHGHAVGEILYHDFTTGTAPDGFYQITSVAANTYTFNVTTANTSGNVTRRGRYYNQTPDPTIADRPDFTTGGAGIIDVEYVYGDWYFLSANAYSHKMSHSATLDTINISEPATAVILNDVGIGMFAAQDLRTLQLTKVLNGGTFTNVVAMRGNVPGTTDHATELTGCDGLDFVGLRTGIIRHDARSTGQAIQVVNSANCTFADTKVQGHAVKITTSFDITFTDTDYCDRLIGFTNTGALYAFNVASKSADIDINGVTFGLGGTVPRVHPYSGILTVAVCDRVKLRNAGTRLSPLTPNNNGINAMSVLALSGGTNTGLQFQNLHAGMVRTAAILTTLNDDKDCRVENYSAILLSTNIAGTTFTSSSLDTVLKAIGAGSSTVAANASVYGNHFHDAFNWDEYGTLVLAMNEPTAATASQVSILSGAPQFTSAPGLAMLTSGDEILFEMPYYAQGHTGFLRGTSTQPTFTGTNPNNHDITYKIDKNDGSGFNAIYRNLAYKRAGAGGANASTTVTMTSTTGVAVGDYVFGTNIGVNAKVVSIDSGTNITVDVANIGTVSGVLVFNQLPNEAIVAADGFKLRIRVVANTTATTNSLTYLSIDTMSTYAAQQAVSYPLDPVAATLSLTGLQTGSEVRVYRESDSVEIAGINATAGGMFDYAYEWTGVDLDVYITVLKVGYQWIRYNNQTLGNAGLTLPVFQAIDRNYRNP